MCLGATFSAFGNETINLWREGQSGLALLNVAGHLVLCLGAVWLSRVLAILTLLWSTTLAVMLPPSPSDLPSPHTALQGQLNPPHWRC